MLQQIFLSIVGFCSGIIIAGGVVGLLIGLSIVPRYAGITHTGNIYCYMKILRFLALYVVIFFSSMAGTFQAEPLLCSFMDFFSGIFLGGWIMALAEMADVFPIFSRRIKLTNGIRWVVIAVAFGKALGSLYYFYKRWFP